MKTSPRLLPRLLKIENLKIVPEIHLFSIWQRAMGASTILIKRVCLASTYYATGYLGFSLVVSSLICSCCVNASLGALIIGPSLLLAGSAAAPRGPPSSSSRWGCPAPGGAEGEGDLRRVTMGGGAASQ